MLFWKETTGWEWIYTTAYSLETPSVDLSSVYLERVSEQADCRCIQHSGPDFGCQRVWRGKHKFAPNLITLHLRNGF